MTQTITAVVTHNGNGDNMASYDFVYEGEKYSILEPDQDEYESEFESYCHKNKIFMLKDEDGRVFDALGSYDQIKITMTIDDNNSITDVEFAS